MNSRFFSLLAAMFAASSLLAQPQQHPNSEKYNDRSLPNARGSVGDATVEVRALFNRDTTTDVEVNANGTISRVQTRIPSPGDDTRTENYNDLELPRFFTKVTGVLPHTPIHIQTHVHFENVNHHDVVDLNEVVKRRPDLVVAEIIAPPHAVAGVPAIIRATIRELNGDVGARANCRLIADGEEVDRAEGIWVDAGGTVQCAFAPLFDSNTALTKELVVVADAIDPGDWDESNNASAKTPITIYESISPFGSFSASVREEEFLTHQFTKHSWSESTRDTQGITQSFRFDAWLRQDVNLDKLSVTANATSNGSLLYSGQTTSFDGPFETPVGSRCTFARGIPEVTVCYEPRYDATRVDVFYGTGDATYRSYGWATRQHPSAPEEPRFTWDSTFVEHTLLARFGSDVRMDVAVGDGFHLFREQPSIALQRSTSSWDLPSQCYYSSYTEEEVCVEIHEQRSMLSGVTSANR